jgi:CBS-domain-containing membrane protein
MMSGVRAADFMTTDVVTTTPQSSVQEATRQLLDRRIAALPVVDDEGRLLGIVSELDLLRQRVPGDPRAHLFPQDEPAAPAPRTVEQVMTTEVYALPDSADESAFASLMTESGVKSVPVVRGAHLVGIVGRRDLLRMLARDDALVAADVEALLAGVDELGQWRVQVEGGEVTLAGTGTPPQAEAAQRAVHTVPGVVRVRVRVAPPAD